MKKIESQTAEGGQFTLTPRRPVNEAGGDAAIGLAA